jgi:hypothetical protein
VRVGQIVVLEGAVLVVGSDITRDVVLILQLFVVILRDGLLKQTTNIL